jgi:hypothetical protein
MRSPISTNMAGDLKALGLDVTNLPTLASLDSATRQGVMNTFVKALGVQCTYCHGSDYAAPTTEKNIAGKMWDNFVRGLAFADKSPIYCDSCHQGYPKFLDRSNHQVLSQWMHDNFVTKLARQDGQTHSCATCHGKPFNGPFLDQWGM